MEERGDGPLFIKAALAGESEHVDAAKLVIGPLANQLLDGGGTIRIRRLAQYTKEGFGFAHSGASSHRIAAKGRLQVGALQGEPP